MSKEKQFWDWFTANEAKYFFLNQVDDTDEKENLLDEFIEHLHSYCDHLYFEIGGHPDKTQDLIITAEGDVDFFDKVETLVEHAPVLENWNIIAFKPVMDGFVIEYNGVKLDPETIYFIPLSNKASQQVGVRMYADHYDPTYDKDFRNAAYLILDNLLGEKSNALDIGYVDIQEMPPLSEREDFMELIKLPDYIAWKKSQNDA